MTSESTKHSQQRRKPDDESGQTIVEYALVVAVISVAVTIALGAAIQGGISNLGTTLLGLMT